MTLRDPDTFMRNESDPVLRRYVIEIGPETERELRANPLRDNQIDLGLFIVFCALEGIEMANVNRDRTLAEVEMALKVEESTMGQLFDRFMRRDESAPEQPEPQPETIDSTCEEFQVIERRMWDRLLEAGP